MNIMKNTKKWPSAFDIEQFKDESWTLKIKYNGGRGHMSIKLFDFLPASQHDFCILVDTIKKSDDPMDAAGFLAKYIVNFALYLGKYRNKYFSESWQTKERALLTAEIKKYISHSKKLSKEFKTPIAHDAIAEIKPKKATIIARYARGELKTFEGYKFSFDSYEFEAYENDEGKFFLLLADTGLSLGITACSVRELCTQINDELLNYLAKSRPNIEHAKEIYARLLAEKAAEGAA